MKPATLALLVFLCAAARGEPPQLRDGFRVARPADVGLHEPPFASLTREVVDARYPGTTSVLVYKDERLVFERYFGAGGINVLNDTRSATKTLTAFIVGQAIADGAIRSAEEPAFAYLQDLAPFAHDGPRKREITIMDLLTMASALECDDFDPKDVGNEENMYPLANWTRWAVDLPTKETFARNPSGRGPFSYCTGGSFLLGQIVQRATKRPLDQYVDAKLLRPLGIVDRQWAQSPGGEYQTGGGLRLRARDLLKLGTLLGADGRWQDAQIVPAAWVRRMQSVTNVVNDEQAYGMQIWQRRFETPCGTLNGWYMSGNGGNAVVSAPLRGMTIVVTRTNYNRRGMHDQTKELIEKHVFAALACTR
jgi:CubicO group peptidase (beta-lactamase class C family)